MKIKLSHINCLRCGHQWIARKTVIKCCPECKSPYWDRERRVPKQNENLKINKV